MNESMSEWKKKIGEQMHCFIPVTSGKEVLSYIYVADGQEIFIEPTFFFLVKGKIFLRGVHDRFLFSHFSKYLFIRGKRARQHTIKRKQQLALDGESVGNQCIIFILLI